MSNPNPNSQNNGNYKPPVTAFNMQGWTPSMCTFTITREDFCAAVLSIAQTYIQDFEQCTYDRGNNGHDALLLWIKSDSSHLIDRKSTENTILRRAVKHVSNQMKEFQNKFCRARDNDGSPDIRDSHFRYGELLALDRYNESSRNMTALVVNPKPFIDAMFDVDGRGYQQQFGSRAPYTDLDFRYLYKKSGGKNGELIGLQIVKKKRDNFANRELHTKFAVKTD